MDGGFGNEMPRAHSQEEHRAPTRYLVIIDSGGSTIARLFLPTREPFGEFDAGTEEVALMTQGLSPTDGAGGPEWDHALEGHSSAERAGAAVYTLDL